jgi:hypothetical protein
MRGTRQIRVATFATAATLLVAAALFVVLRQAGERADAATARASGKTIRIVSRTFKLSRADEKQRLTVRCPGRRFPYGGGMRSSPGPGAGGEGAYPHSYERLGVQGGWHVTAVLYDPTARSTNARKVKLQVACARWLGHVTPPHTTVYVKPGQTRSAVATCPGRRHLISGGFQRTDFVSRGGNFVTESHAISSKSWLVSGQAFGRFGGELTAIAYCLRSKRPLVKQVSASTPVARGSAGTVTTPPCPPSRRLVSGGFAGVPGSLFLTDGAFNANGSWSSTAYNHFGPATATLTAYGYCMKR